ncbi:MAG: SDR family oxidoreductase [Candidatus Korobacteraceae bacterium]
MKIVVIGGTGLIGSRLVPKLREHGHEALAGAPNTGVNSITGEGLDKALKGASVVVDVSNAPSWEDAAVMKFFETSTRNLLAAEETAGVRHHVALSVVGSERMLASGYFRAKVAQENLIKGSSVPYSIVRATQFFEFVKGIADFSTEGNKVLLPPALIQPMAADDVAGELARVAIGSPVKGTVEIGGPQQFHLDEFARQALAAWKDPRDVVADPNAHYYGIAVSATTLIPGDDARLGHTRFTTWLSQPKNNPAMRDSQRQSRGAA